MFSCFRSNVFWLNFSLIVLRFWNFHMKRSIYLAYHRKSTKMLSPLSVFGNVRFLHFQKIITINWKLWLFFSINILINVDENTLYINSTLINWLNQIFEIYSTNNYVEIQTWHLNVGANHILYHNNELKTQLMYSSTISWLLTWVQIDEDDHVGIYGNAFLVLSNA